MFQREWGDVEGDVEEGKGGDKGKGVSGRCGKEGHVIT